MNQKTNSNASSPAVCQKCNRPLRTWRCFEAGQKRCEHSSHCLCKNPADAREIEVVAESEGWDITRHAYRRYHARSITDDPPPIEEAWSEAIPVNVKDKKSGPEFRWHPPTYLLFVGWDGTVKTAIKYSNTTQIDTDRLKYCGLCRSWWDPLEWDECNWCEGEATHPKLRDSGEST